MDEPPSRLIDVGQLRRGMFIQLDLGWMDHPFPRGSFKITSDEQIRSIRALGLTEVRYFPARSDLGPEPAASGRAAERIDPAQAARAAQRPAQPQPDAEDLRELQRRQLQTQQASLRACERRFGEAVQLYERVLDGAAARPVALREQCEALVSGCVAEILVDGDAGIRLLSEASGERQATHPVNVLVLALLLGRALGLPVQTLTELGLAALLHDLGKQQLPPHLRHDAVNLEPHERAIYRSHVDEGLKVGRRMGLSDGALRAMAEHHQMVDGSGFSAQQPPGPASIGGKVLALVNSYDRLCNPPLGTEPLTPHEALALLFARHKARYDAAVLGAFIRMMGVYPPGSVVQLANERYAMVVSVNSSRPLRPRVLVHDPALAPQEVLVLDLESTPELGIRRSLRPAQLPTAVRQWLAPRHQVRCFYERQTPMPEEAG